MLSFYFICCVQWLCVTVVSTYGMVMSFCIQWLCFIEQYTSLEYDELVYVLWVFVFSRNAFVLISLFIHTRSLSSWFPTWLLPKDADSNHEIHLIWGMLCVRLEAYPGRR